MSSPYTRAPHVGDRHFPTPDYAPQAALLIDFDNVTLGRGSDLTKELRTLLNSEIIKGKVAVQRAYADWRRYPQYIVPLSEASIDLIFAPAYGSSKKNATDIRMAIDAVELVFVRPEIGTFILLTGDSDFSSVVLKLKEYGKYVIGVGIQESSSDILVQNCDEYYSYTALTGLTKTSEAERVQFDPWVLVEEAVKKMTERRDVMRSDRLKQVMREIDKSFNEAEHGFPKFSKFLAEASSRGLVKLRKMDNGQYEVAQGKKKRRRGRREEPQRDRAAPVVELPKSGDPIEHAYALLRSAMGELSSGPRQTARDSDVKRRILTLEPNFDEAELGFPKFSLFLKQAEEHRVVSLQRKDPEGYTEVTLTGGGPGVAAPVAPATQDIPATQDVPAEAAAPAPTVRSRGRRTRPRRDADAASRDRSAEVEVAPDAPVAPIRTSQEPEADLTEVETQAPPFEPVADPPPVAEPEPVAEPKPRVEPEPRFEPKPPVEPEPPASRASTPTTRTLHPRQQRRRGPDGPPPIFEGQGVAVGPSVRPDAGRSTPQQPVTGDRIFQGLPSESGAIERYLTHRYKGVGEKTAEQVVEAFGRDVFVVLDSQPERVAEVLSEHRAEALLQAWQADKARRSGGNGGGGS